jgi:hypothetical protein
VKSVGAMDIPKTKEVFAAVKPALANTKWRVRIEVVKMFIDLSLHFKKLDYFNGKL